MQIQHFVCFIVIELETYSALHIKLIFISKNPTYNVILIVNPVLKLSKIKSDCVTGYESEGLYSNPITPLYEFLAVSKISHHQL